MLQPTRRNLLLVATNEDVKPRTDISNDLPFDFPCMEAIKNNTGVYWIPNFWASNALYHEEAAGSYLWLCTGLDMGTEVSDIRPKHGYAAD